MEKQDIRERFYKWFTARKGQKDIADWWLAEIESILEEKRREVKEVQFQMNISEYLPLVEAWNKTNFDVPFDHGYAKAKDDILSLLSTPISNKK